MRLEKIDEVDLSRHFQQSWHNEGGKIVDSVERNPYITDLKLNHNGNVWFCANYWSYTLQSFEYVVYSGSKNLRNIKEVEFEKDKVPISPGNITFIKKSNNQCILVSSPLKLDNDKIPIYSNWGLHQYDSQLNHKKRWEDLSDIYGMEFSNDLLYTMSNPSGKPKEDSINIYAASFHKGLLELELQKKVVIPFLDSLTSKDGVVYALNLIRTEAEFNTDLHVFEGTNDKTFRINELLDNSVVIDSSNHLIFFVHNYPWEGCNPIWTKFVAYSPNGESRLEEIAHNSDVKAMRFDTDNRLVALETYLHGREDASGPFLRRYEIKGI